MVESHTLAKFVFQLAGRSDTFPYAVAIGLLLAVIWVFRKFRLMELDTQQRERQDQIRVIKALFGAAIILVPMTTFLRPANPVDPITSIPTTTKIRQSMFDVDLDKVDILTRITWRSLTHRVKIEVLDIVIGVTVVSIVLVLSVMVWPMACDLCAFRTPVLARQRPVAVNATTATSDPSAKTTRDAETTH
jgi:hypothetical protein